MNSFLHNNQPDPTGKSFNLRRMFIFASLNAALFSIPALFLKGDLVGEVKCLLTTRGKHQSTVSNAVSSHGNCLPEASGAAVCLVLIFSFLHIDSIVMRNQQRVYIDQKYLVRIISFLLNALEPSPCCS